MRLIVFIMKVLFVCNQGMNRSKTAALLFKGKFETRSAGLYSDKSLSENDLSWADLVVVMEDAQRSEIAKRFPSIYLKKQIISFDIPDIYRFNQEELKTVLDSKLEMLYELV